MAYAREHRGARPWWRQRQVLRAAARPPYRVLAKSGNGCGKTWLSGVFADFRYEMYDPGITLITGPRFELVRDTTFKEIRRFQRGDPNVYAKNPVVESSFEHWIHGTTASDPVAFHGHHDQAIAVIFEEATGVYKELWNVVRGIIVGGDCSWLCIYNPMDRDCQAFVEESAVDAEGNPAWTVIQISQFEHPNIISEVCGFPPPIPGSIELTELRNNLTVDPYWGTWVVEEDYNPDTDIDLWDARLYGLPDREVVDGVLDEPVEEDGQWMSRREFLGIDPRVTEELIREGLPRAFPKRYWRPGPEGDARVLGRYPRQPAYAVYHQGMWDTAAKGGLTAGIHTPVEIGCDVARFGDDMTVVHAHRGGICLEHESRQQFDCTMIANWLHGLCEKYGAMYQIDPRHDVIVRIDDTGVGGGVTDQARGYNFVPVVAQRRAMREDKYPDARSEMHFSLAEAMIDGKVDTTRLPSNAVHEVRRQAEQVMWKQDTKGRRRVLPKAMVKDALGRSPDDLDAMALAHYKLGGAIPRAERKEEEPERVPLPRRDFGRGTDRLFSR